MGAKDDVELIDRTDLDRAIDHATLKIKFWVISGVLANLLILASAMVPVVFYLGQIDTKLREESRAAQSERDGIEQLVGWAILHNAPTDIVAKVVGVDATYVYDSAHNDIADLGASQVTGYETIPNFTYVNGIIDGDDVDLPGLTPTEVFDAAVVLFQWTLPAPGSLLLAYIDQSLDGSVPQVIDSSAGVVRWNASGIAVL
jgi:hypothetical protein